MIRDEEDLRPVGELLDELGVTMRLGPSHRITEVLVIAKVVDLDDGQVCLALASNPTLDWITEAGLLESARALARAHRESDDDD